MKKNTMLMALLAVISAVAFYSMRVPHASGQFTKSVEVDRGTYYRLKVKLAYKSEQQDFDIVVGCNVRQINYRDNSRTLEVGLIPSVFGRRMNDGKGLVVRPPRACRGETTANGQVPANLLPVVVVYDDADTLAFGTAYLSEDAYESPLSVLKFGGASIERANASEFEAFRREQPNLVKPASYHTPSGSTLLKDRNLTAAPIPMGTGCYGYARFRLTGEQQERARALWPADRPRYWRPATSEASAAISPSSPPAPMQTDHEGARPGDHAPTIGLNVEIADLGMPTRGRGDQSRNAFPLSYYPDIGGWIALPWPSDPPRKAAVLLRDGPRVGASIDFRDGATRGFAYCRPYLGLFPTGIEYGDPSQAPWARYVRMPASDRVDGIEVAGDPFSTSSGIGFNGPRRIFERDEFLFQIFVIGLQSTRGDV